MHIKPVNSDQDFLDLLDYLDYHTNEHFTLVGGIVRWTSGTTTYTFLTGTIFSTGGHDPTHVYGPSYTTSTTSVSYKGISTSSLDDPSTTSISIERTGVAVCSWDE